MSEFTSLLGEPALSDYRKRKLVRRLACITGPKAALEAHFVYLVESEATLLEHDITSLQDLLHGKFTSDLHQEDLHLVVPRLGTQSPWSSKATDIARRCGLHSVQRIERGTAYFVPGSDHLDPDQRVRLRGMLHDRMTQSVLDSLADAHALFIHNEPARLRRIALSDKGGDSLRAANRDLGLALSEDEIAYLFAAFCAMGRDPTDAELMMFAQANSEHCRHKIFNAQWIIDGDSKEQSLFSMIRNTHARSPAGVLSAYHDNSAVLAGPRGERFFIDPHSGAYIWKTEKLPFQIKV
ncbi:MAG: phosphoribosylformylglycinamidine synthase, partial [Lysobacterales bacterium]